MSGDEIEAIVAAVKAQLPHLTADEQQTIRLHFANGRAPLYCLVTVAMGQDRAVCILYP